MSRARRVVPGTTYLLTRRCARRCFFLKPRRDGRSRRLFAYCLAVAAVRYGIEVHAIQVLSNHWHAVVSDPGGKLSFFMRDLGSLTARAFNTLLGRGESFWAPGSFSAVELHGRGAVLDKLLYVFANVTRAGLVARPGAWPGLTTHPEDFGARVLRTARPEQFFRQLGAEEGGLPETAALPITRPPGFEDLGDQELRALIRERLEGRLRVIHADREANGLGPFLGPEGVLGQDPLAGAGSTFPDRGVDPVIACRDVNERKERLRELVAWRRAYRAAWLQWRSGDREAVFPFGTFWMRVTHHARCERAPPLAA